MPREYLFYDLETWSLDPSSTRLVEIAWQRTDEFFAPLEPPVALACQPPPECVPQPEALLVHNKTPQWARDNGLVEYQLARRVWDEFNRPNTCVIGYNNIRFDDECLRYLFYRNLLDPYTHQYKNGNTRWDVFDLVRLAFAIRPELLTWPHAGASLKLEDLTRVNAIDNGAAHDASNDVAATIALAQKLVKGNPRMVDVAYNQSHKPGLEDALKLFLGSYCLHISPRIPRAQRHISLVYLVCRNPHNNKQIYAIDLNAPVDMLLEESSEQIREMLFTKRAELPEDFAIPRIKTIHLNRAPLLLAPKLLGAKRAEELGINLELCISRYTQLAATPALADKLIDVLDPEQIFGTQTFDGKRDADVSLYDGFVADADRRLAEQLHKKPLDEWPDAKASWKDERLDSLWLRLLGRLMPESLTSEQSRQWQAYLHASWSGQISERSGSKVASLLQAKDLLEQHPGHTGLTDLIDYLEQLDCD